MNNKPLHLLLFVLTVVVFFPCAHAQDVNVDSKVTAVTVYSDRALITRSMSQFLSNGIHTLVFDGLPDGLLNESMKVVGESNVSAKIVDVKIEQSFLDTIPASRPSELANRLAGLKERKNSIDSRRLIVMGQMNAIDSLRANYTRGLATGSTAQKAMTDEWDRVLQFVERKKTDYLIRVENYQRETATLLRQIETTEKELQNINGQTQRVVKKLSVVVSMPKTDSVRLDISYIIPQAEWTPLYEARVSSSDSTLQLVYTGQVSQSTGEDWKNVDLILSTAQPRLGQTAPQLSRWIVDFQPHNIPSSYEQRGGYDRVRPTSHITNMHGRTLSGKVLDASTMDPLVGANVILEGTSLGSATDVNGEFTIYNVPDGVYNAKVSYIGYMPSTATGIRIDLQHGASETFYLSSSGVQLQAVTIAAERPNIQMNATNSAIRSIDMEHSEVRPQTAITSASFRIASRQSLPSDGQTHKVGITIENLPVNFEYQASPKLIPAVYVQAKGKNTSDYPFLSGPVNVFFENAFIATSHLQTIMPNDSVAVNCGVDEGIKVERKQVRRFTEEVGTFSKDVRVIYEFSILVRNLKNKPERIRLHDHVPVSANEDVTVKMIEPQESVLKPDADGVLTWIVELGPQDTKRISLKFSVEYPKGRYVYGLE